MKIVLYFLEKISLYNSEKNSPEKHSKCEISPLTSKSILLIYLERIYLQIVSKHNWILVNPIILPMPKETNRYNNKSKQLLTLKLWEHETC